MISAVDSDLQIKRGPAHRDTLPPPATVSEGGGSKKTFFRPYGPQFGLKIREPGPPGPSPGSATGFDPPFSVIFTWICSQLPIFY